MDLDRRGAELLFQALTEREETNSIAVASNQPFSGWTRTFTDPRLGAAIIDRLTSPVIATNCAALMANIECSSPPVRWVQDRVHQTCDSHAS